MQLQFEVGYYSTQYLFEEMQYVLACVSVCLYLYRDIRNKSVL